MEYKVEKYKFLSNLSWLHFSFFIFHRMWMKKSNMTGTNKCSRVSTKLAKKKVTTFDPQNDRIYNYELGQ